MKRKGILFGAALLALGIGVYKKYGVFIPKKGKALADIVDWGNDPYKAKIFTAEHTDGRDSCFRRIIRKMDENGESFYNTEESSGLIGNDDVVLLKVNSQWDKRGGTNVDLVKSVIQGIIDHPDGFKGEIVIVDNGQDQFGSKLKGGALDWKETNSNDRILTMVDVADEFKEKDYKVSAYLWDSITKNRVMEFDEGDTEQGFVVNNQADEATKIIVSYPKFITEFGTQISFKHGVWDGGRWAYDSQKLKVINMPVFKTHFMYGVTGCIKSYMGVPSDKLVKGKAHSTIGLGSMGTLMRETRIPDLNILDAIYINPYTDRKRMGPSTSYDEAVMNGMVAVSKDPVALDYWAAEHILYEVMRKRKIDLPKKSDRDCIEPGNFGYWLRLSMIELKKGGFDTTINEDEMDVVAS